MRVTIPVLSFGVEIDLEVEVDHTPAEEATRDCPGGEEVNEAVAVYRDGVNVWRLLEDYEKETIARALDDAVGEYLDRQEEDAQVGAYEARHAREEDEDGRYEP